MRTAVSALLTGLGLTRFFHGVITTLAGTGLMLVGFALTLWGLRRFGAIRTRIAEPARGE